MIKLKTYGKLKIGHSLHFLLGKSIVDYIDANKDEIYIVGNIRFLMLCLVEYICGYIPSRLGKKYKFINKKLIIYPINIIVILLVNSKLN